LVACLTASVGAGPKAATAPAKEAAKNRLLVVVVVDQCRSDYLPRFRKDLKGGLARLLDQGVNFTQAFHKHAVTATGVGHAAVSTGSFPSHSGIVNNDWHTDNGRNGINCVGDASVSIIGADGTLSKNGGRSPKNLEVTALADWVKASDPESKAFGASRKDRGAILLGGKNADGAFWYDTATGGFLTSTYYRKDLPDWVRQFNEKGFPRRYFGTLWTPLAAPSDPVGSAIVETDAGWFSRGFPHAIGEDSMEPDSAFFSAFGGTPFMDEYLLEFVKELVKSEELGRDDHLDFLGISFSALDSVGHDYGPNSPEVFDAVLRVDRYLGQLLDFLDSSVGPDSYTIALSADHGAMELPEYLKSIGRPGRRLGARDIQCLQEKAGELLTRLGGDEDWWINGYYLNYSELGDRNLQRSEVERDAASLLEQCDFVRKVWTRTELESGPEPADRYARAFRHNYYPDRSPDLMIQTEEYFLASDGVGASHGSPYDYDSHVPFLILAPGRAGAQINERVATVDIAPTLAELVGVSVLGHPDGVSRVPLLP